ncbi:hypothetical protein LJC32_01555 [Oscillospiraceae bacterium OttesenSCG-928-F05]|nr:hypothetical protein [Oscillospiraceae bacterium OttesenSCG-928-F05]
MVNVIKSFSVNVVDTKPVFYKQTPTEDVEDAVYGGRIEVPSSEDLIREELQAEYEKKRKRLQREFDKKMEKAEEKAARAVDDAKAEAEAILEAARIEADRLKNEAIEAGAEAGFNQGLQQVQDEVAEAFEIAQKEINNVLSEAETEKTRIIGSCEQDILGLAVDIAGKILDVEIAENDEAYLAMVKKALAAVRSEKQITLRVNPAECERFFAEKTQRILAAGTSFEAQIISDGTVPPGGLVIDSRIGMIDGGAKTQLQQIADEFELSEAART